MTDPVTDFLSLLKAVRPAGVNQWMAKCPSHDDWQPSLSVSRGEDGRLLAKCHTGCSYDAILSAVGWRRLGASGKSRRTQPKSNGQRVSRNGQVFATESDAVAHIESNLNGRFTCSWVYQDATANEVFRIARFDSCRSGRPKQYRPLYHASNGWHIGDPPGPLPLYGLPELSESTTIWICEGEKCAEILGELGFTATTNAHGANGTDKTDWTPLAGKQVILCPDHDAAGETHTENILGHLDRLHPSATARVLRLPVTNKGDDIEQFVEAHRADDASDEVIRLKLEALV